MRETDPGLNVSVLVGGPCTGKSARLEARRRELLEEGVPAEELLVVRGGGATGAGAGADGGREVSARGMGLLVAALPEFTAWSGRRARVLEPFEEQVLFEDLRPCGIPQKQLRRIMDYLRACWTELACDDGWLDMREERLVHDTLQANLRFTQGILRDELAFLAVSFLRARDELGKARPSWSHVLVDDFGLLSRASQELCVLLARDELAVAGDPSFAPPVDGERPHPAGLAELVERFAVEAQDLGAGSHLAREEHRVAADVRAEFDDVVGLVAGAVAEGCQVAVVCENATWRRNMAKTLQAAGLAVRQPPREVRVRDFADEDACRAARIRSEERLACDPDDGVALRSLYGFGDHLARSLQLQRLREDHPGCTLAQLWRPEARPAVAARQAPERDGAPEQGGAVFVASPDALAGTHFDLVVFGGFVNGWTPARAYFDAFGSRREQLRRSACRAVECARRAASRRLVFSGFAEADLEFAERLGLRYARIRLQAGVRTCTLSPNVLS